MMSPKISADILNQLYETILSRKNADPNTSYSAKLLAKGSKKTAEKFGEEAVECLIECATGNQKELITESADVLYHLLVMWVSAGVSPDDVWQELHRREGTSGIAEKAARSSDPLK
ncbi:Phosphoribosyl-ATP pyrophosphohydrolase (HisI2) (PDB:6J22) [Commensalibacter communis]|uniref:Phosphoribosyl-ATP pyrophosphatase n=2 Tax=Commensalibacter communis TaxID=2972786 RepID=A0A9W4TMK0_9PROT|nr:Phosphoribosyl-ATP pyrophosphohydrolase (HisI2) (PDB:6J22) [Commensalibacter communis]CAI3926772.1 Phosphoribosyl-ATP pyrophosphohydrolase (HisI2) (PDB:6J22) [Commensalibacter communis]CAI3927958.1 Phosphoribosyl-ATP pyrophosphohydrolase (HisI2) (PDB:6J22) [Commensalibacter communis]CAI3928183.1 Phosphoribosyl-ATP pyrophosphohydrolase (HisI2) (PDB:6J22) [Commensalibacter communis]CAI3934545.1 Phosphoribosyl-ATP pyrophosphohydrolase (HisI2) (PDB:6J22) [Commensalibacter communis]